MSSRPLWWFVARFLARFGHELEGTVLLCEIHLGAELEIEICPHVKLVPGIDFYDCFTEAQRRTYDKFNGFIAVAGCRLVVDF